MANGGEGGVVGAGQGGALGLLGERAALAGPLAGLELVSEVGLRLGTNQPAKGDLDNLKLLKERDVVQEGRKRWWWWCWCVCGGGAE